MDGRMGRVRVFLFSRKGVSTVWQGPKKSAVFMFFEKTQVFRQHGVTLRDRA